MLREQARILSSLLAVLDLLTVASSHLYVVQRSHPNTAPGAFSSWFFLCTPCVFLLVLYYSGAYGSFRVTALREEAWLLARAVVVGGAVVLGLSWFTPQGLPQRAELAVFLPLLFGVLCSGRLA